MPRAGHGPWSSGPVGVAIPDTSSEWSTLEPSHEPGPIEPDDDRRFLGVAPQLAAWSDERRARPADDPPPLDEPDRLLAIRGTRRPISPVRPR